MKQPAKNEIRQKLIDVLEGRATRESVGDWANDLIIHHDEDMIIKDWDAWVF